MASTRTNTSASAGAGGATVNGTIRWIKNGETINNDDNFDYEEFKDTYVSFSKNPLNSEFIDRLISKLTELYVIIDDIEDKKHLLNLILFYMEIKQTTKILNTEEKREHYIRTILKTIDGEKLWSDLTFIYKKYMKSIESINNARARVLPNININDNTSFDTISELKGIMEHILRNPETSHISREHSPYSFETLKPELINKLIKLETIVTVPKHKDFLRRLIDYLNSNINDEEKLRNFIRKHYNTILSTIPIPSWIRPGHVEGGYQKTRRFVRRTGKSRKQKRKTSSKRY